MAITLTDRAADHVRQQLEKRGKGLGLRLSVKKSGCSGYSYVVDFADEIADDDNVFEDKGVKLIVNPLSYIYLNGSEVDYGKEGLNESFRFNNPNQTGACGCGESVSF
jgi:iron-sulfur cluster assembly protein